MVFVGVVGLVVDVDGCFWLFGSCFSSVCFLFGLSGWFRCFFVNWCSRGLSVLLFMVYIFLRDVLVWGCEGWVWMDVVLWWFGWCVVMDIVWGFLGKEGVMVWLEILVDCCRDELCDVFVKLGMGLVCWLCLFLIIFDCVWFVELVGCWLF